MKTVSRTTTSTSASASTARKGLHWALLGGGLALLAAGSIQLAGARRTPPASQMVAQAGAPVGAPNEAAPVEGAERVLPARKLSWRVVKSIGHDRGAFLQGLLWDNGGFYESTGLEGRSSLRRLDASGRVQKQIALPPQVFGEGLTAWKDSLIQISWKDGRAWKWGKATFEARGEFRYKGEGWGITNDGRELIMSDGSDTLFFRDPETFAVRRSTRVTFNGQPLRSLNELEFIGGRVWANVWQTDTIVLIDPGSGVSTGYLDLSGILPASERNGREDVLNGIAYDPASKRIWVSGKQWPRIFQIQVEGQN